MIIARGSTRKWRRQEDKETTTTGITSTTICPWPCTDPKSGLWPEMGKMPEKWILAPPGKRGRNFRKMGKLGQKWVKLGHFPIFRPLIWSGQNPFFGHFFSHFMPEARFRVRTGQSGSQCKCNFFGQLTQK